MGRNREIGIDTCILLILCIKQMTDENLGFPGGSEVKASAWNAGDPGSIPGLAPHSSILAWRIPWTEDPGRLQPVLSRRVGHD